MDTETELKRSVFLGVRQQQQLEKIKCENTYQIYIRNRDDPLYQAGISQHNQFSVTLDPIGKEHIKNCKITLKSLKLPGETTASANFKSQVYLDCNIAKNVIVLGGRRNNIIGSAYVKEAVHNELFTTNSINTFAGRPDYDTVTNRLKEITATNKGLVPNGGDAANPTAVLRLGQLNLYNEDFTLPLPDVSKAGDNITRAITKGCYGWCPDTPVYCHNPFGKKLDFRILSHDILNLAELGAANGDGVEVLLEVELLPDYRENDRLNY